MFGPPTIRANEILAMLRVSGTVALLLLAFCFLTGSRLWTLSTREAPAFASLLWFVGLLLVAVGLLACCFLIFGGTGFLVWLVALAVWARAAWRVRVANRYALWNAMTLAVDRRAPLVPLVRAFADECGGLTGLHAHTLGQQLFAGQDLVEAIQTVPRALPNDALLAASVGRSTGDLHGAMAALAEGRTIGRPPLFSSVLWLMVFVPVAFFTSTFLLIKVAPSYVKIFDDFDIALPPATVAMFRIAQSGTLPVLCLVLFLSLVFVWLQWRGTIRPLLPGLARLLRWNEMQRVLRLLSVAVRNDVPLPSVFAEIARHYPLGWVRSKLRGAAFEAGHGATWQSSLQQEKLLDGRDAALLVAAERNGNLAWVLNQLADSYRSRSNLLVRAWAETSLPILICLVGLLVGMFAVAWFMPLAQLIIDLV